MRANELGKNRPVDFQWHQVEAAVYTIVGRMQLSNYAPSRIIAIARGGLVPGVMLSHTLKLPLEVITAESYTPDNKQTPETYICLESLTCHTGSYGPETLVIDDIYDTGRTMEEVRKILPNCNYAVLVHKGYNNMPGKEHYIGMRSGEGWITFPWERVIMPRP